MSTNIIFFLILFSGSIFGATVFRRRADIILPVTLMGVNLVLFLIGILTDLKYGFYTVLFFSAFFYLISLVYFFRNRLFNKRDEIREIISCVITPGTIYFLVLSIVFLFISHGLVAHSWDEFSFWMDAVKAMVWHDDFVTNPALNTGLRTYPPGISLFQYFMQKVFILSHPKYGFMEWRCYYAKQLYISVMLLPLFSVKKNMGKLDYIAACLISVFLPMIFDSAIYTTCYIDSCLAILIGAGFIVVLKCSIEKDYGIEKFLFVLLIISNTPFPKVR